MTTLAALGGALLLAAATTACSDSKDLSANSAVTTSTAGEATIATVSLPAVTDAPTTTSTTTTTTTTTTTLPPTTTVPPTTTIPLVTEGAVVLVANASAVPGAAGRLTESLRSMGFHVADPTNSAGYETSLDASKIYAKPEAQAVADSISRVMGGIPVSRMPTPAPIMGATVGLGDAGVLVMLGTDLAQ
jgi:hypothetical protein